MDPREGITFTFTRFSLLKSSVHKQFGLQIKHDSGFLCTAIKLVPLTVPHDLLDNFRLDGRCMAVLLFYLQLHIFLDAIASPSSYLPDSVSE